MLLIAGMPYNDKHMNSIKRVPVILANYALRKHFINCSSLILLVAGFIKILIFALNKDSALRTSFDAVFYWFSLRSLIGITGSLEILLGMYLIYSDSSERVKLTLIAWVTTGFLSYRLANGVLGGGHCSCLGRLEHLSAILGKVSDMFLAGALAYFVSGIALNVWLLGRPQHGQT